MESGFRLLIPEGIYSPEQERMIVEMIKSDRIEKEKEQKYLEWENKVTREWFEHCAEVGRCPECASMTCQHKARSPVDEQPEVTTLAKALKERTRNMYDNKYWFFLTFTQNADWDLTEERIHELMSYMVKNASYFEYTLEHHKDKKDEFGNIIEKGKLHVHLLCAYELSKVPTSTFFNEKWTTRHNPSDKNKFKIGNIDFQNINFKRNPKSIESIKKYMSKENPPVLKIDYTQPPIVYPTPNAPQTKSTPKKTKTKNQRSLPKNIKTKNGKTKPEDS